MTSPTRRVHVVGAGPRGLLLAALLQPVDGVEVCLSLDDKLALFDQHAGVASDPPS